MQVDSDAEEVDERVEVSELRGERICNALKSDIEVLVKAVWGDT